MVVAVVVGTVKDGFDAWVGAGDTGWPLSSTGGPFKRIGGLE